MPRTIHKFPLSLVERQIVEMPAGSEILSAQDQGGVVTLWALCDPRRGSGPVEVTIIGTGHPVPADLGLFYYVGTVQQSSFVWHVFAKRLNDG